MRIEPQYRKKNMQTTKTTCKQKILHATKCLIKTTAPVSKAWWKASVQTYLSCVRHGSHLFIQRGEVLSQSLEFTLYHPFKRLVSQLKLPGYVRSSEFTPVIVNTPRTTEGKRSAFPVRVPSLARTVATRNETESPTS